MSNNIRLLILLCAALLSGCATPPEQRYGAPSTAFSQPETTTAGKIFETEIAQNPGKSGVEILPLAGAAFRTRNAMARVAEKSLDVQYFIWEADNTGRILAYQLLEAADRGVRVRLLLDDINIRGRDIGIAAMDLHPNIEVRLFNPFDDRGGVALEMVSNLDRLNHRMHNKAFIMDSAFAVIGGRNIGDHYFGASPEINFRDIDLFVAGPAAQTIANSFDLFWNSKWALPASSVIDNFPTKTEAGQLRAKLDQWVSDHQQKFPYKIDQTKEAVYQRLDQIRDRLVWADVEVLYDDPEKKVDTTTGYQGITPRLHELGDQIEQELLMEAAYLIPGERGVESIKGYADRGLHVRILTNSMATNDVAAAFVGYRRYRNDMLKNGVELYELKPDTGTQKKFWSLIAGKSAASLHSKIFVVDRKITGIGSFNMDPRSSDLNTEILLLIHSPELAGRMIKFMESGVNPSNSYQLVLDSNDDIVWISEENGSPVRETVSDPQSGFWRPVSAWFISLLPIEKHL